MPFKMRLLLFMCELTVLSSLVGFYLDCGIHGCNFHSLTIYLMFFSVVKLNCSHSSHILDVVEMVSINVLNTL